MRLNILPTEPKFFDDFRQLAGLIHEGTSALAAMCEEWSAQGPRLQRILEIKHASYEARHEALMRLAKSFVTPIDREDIHALVCSLESILDYVHGTAVRMQLFSLPAVTPQCLELARILEESGAHIHKAVDALPSFKDFSPWRQTMQELERRADEVYRAALGALFANGNEPLFVIKWKEIYENIETAVDRCADTCDVLEAIVLKHA